MSQVKLNISPMSSTPGALIGNEITIRWELTDCVGSPISLPGRDVVIEGYSTSLEKTASVSTNIINITLTPTDSYTLGCGVYDIKYYDSYQEYKCQRAFFITDNPDEINC